MFGSIHHRAYPNVPAGRVVVVVCLLWSLAGFTEERAAVRAGATQEIWAQSQLAGQPTGYYREKTEAGSDNHTLTLIENDFVMNREGGKVEMKSSSQYEEGADGHLLRVRTDMSSSKQETHVDVTVGANSLRVLATTGGKTYERSVPVEGALIGPEAARRLALARLKSPGDVFTYQTFYPEMGAVVTLTNTLVGPEELTIDGKKWSSLKVEQALSAMPGKTILWLDSTGRILRQLVPTPFGDVETVRTPQDKLQLAGAGPSLPAETFSRTVVPANIRLPEERLIEEMKIRITQRKPELGWPDLNAENQRVLEKTANYVVLEIHRAIAGEEDHRPVPSTPDSAPYLKANALLQSDDANVQSIARQVVGNDDNLLRAARALQKWTNQNMHPDMGIALAPASEVVHDRRGTCVGNSMLLGSLVRAAGIPSRIRMGFVYVDGAWGGHAWVDVLAGKDWVALDGTLYSPGPVDAARFSVFTSNFEDGGSAQMGSFAQLVGNMDIKILEYTVNGRHFVVPEDAPAFMVDGDTYRNPWLGLSVTKPRAFHFSKLNAMWPDNTIVAMEGPQRRVVEIESYSGSLPTSESPDYEKYLHDEGIVGEQKKVQINDRRAVLVSSAEKAGLVLVRKGDLWVIKASGTGASDLLMQVAQTVKLTDSTVASGSAR
ncbi:MAG TPA: transglutaminase-like domain-containing protein [Candidatus Angelobacter sp.]